MTDPTDDFWVVLPSNSNMDTHPNNTQSDYTVRLRKPIEFTRSEDWEVAILGIYYTHAWYNFDNPDVVRIFYSDPDSVTNPNDHPIAGFRHVDVIIRRRYYKTVEQLGELLCLPLPTISTEIAFEHDYVTGKCRYRVLRGHVAIYSQQKFLADALGLECTATRPEGFIADLKVYYKYSLEGTRKVSLPRLDTFYVYSDVAKYQAVGDADAPLLGIVSVDGEFGTACYNAFNPLTFVGISKSHISEIRVLLRTETGAPVCFLANSGSVICCLRFRRRKNPI